MSKSLMKLSLLMFGIFSCCFSSVTRWKELSQERNLVRHKRVVGGETASSGQWPWQTALCILRRFELCRNCDCGGTLIGPRWVVTAAHCFYDYQEPDTLVLFGVHKLRSETSTRQSRYVIRYINHPSYNTIPFFADITLLELETAVTYNDYVQPLALPNFTTTVTSYQSCVVSGFGNTKRKRKKRKGKRKKKGVLKYADVEIIPLHLCKSWYSKTMDLPDDHFCAGYESGGKDTCEGDSGGPLVCAKSHANANPNPTHTDYFLVGVTSFGKGCGQRRSPGVYTNVTMYLEWILQHIETPTAPGPGSQQSTSGSVRTTTISTTPASGSQQSTSGSVRTATISATLASGSQQSTGGSVRTTTISTTTASDSQQRTSGSVSTTTISTTAVSGSQQSTGGLVRTTTISTTTASASQQRTNDSVRTTTISTTTGPGAQQTTTASSSEAQIAKSYFVSLAFALLQLLMHLPN